MSSTKYLKNVAIVGATGNLGSYFVEALLKTGKHTVTALTRGGGKGKIPNGVKVLELDYDDETALVTALQGQDFLAIVLGGTAPPETHSRIVKAAAKAGVSYVMPTTYGADVTNENLVRDDMYHQGAVQKVKEIERLGLNHICMTCGFWYGYSLTGGDTSFGIDIQKKKVTFFDDGTTKINVSTFEQCGRALAALLSLPESGATPSVSDWKNKQFRFASFRLSQREMLDAIQRVQCTSDTDWEITYEPSSKRYADGLAALQKGDFLGYMKAMYSRALYPSADADYESRHGTSNNILGLPEEDLDKMTRQAAEQMEGST